MRRVVALGGCVLTLLASQNLATCSAAETNIPPAKPKVVTVGRVQQATQKVVRSEDFLSQSPRSLDSQLERVLTKLEKLEKHLIELETQKAQLEQQLRALESQSQSLSRTPHREPPGSPDGLD